VAVKQEVLNLYLQQYWVTR